MSLPTTLRACALAALMASAAGLSACGKTGPLERPGPLFGQERNTTKAADEQTRQAQDPARPVDTVDPRDRTTDPAPPRTLPIDGQGQDPTASSPQGALPDPYANPRR
jgi:predicted small lipoprotein YifL